MLQALAEKDIALAKQREEADDMVTEWKGRLLAAQATAQERADELEGQLHATRTEADQLRLSSAQQVQLSPWFMSVKGSTAGHFWHWSAPAAFSPLQVAFF